MPGFTVPEFRRKAVIIAVGGVYDPRIPVSYTHLSMTASITGI